MRIIAKNQMLIEFIIESDVFFADRTKTLVRHYLIREEKRTPRQIKILQYLKRKCKAFC